jgi:small subunit ribosomal protein S6
MVIVDSNKAKDGYEKCEADALECITRHGAKIVKSVKWDERRLAYEIDKVRRGTYILIQFDSETSAIVKIERQFQLSETVLRALVTVDEDGIETETGSSRERAEAATAVADDDGEDSDSD